MAVSAQAEDDGLLLAGLLAFQRFVDDYLDGMGWFRGRDDALGAGEL